MITRLRFLAVAAAALTLSTGLLLGGALAASAQVAGHSATPKIVARPDNLMVNTTTVLTGSGFKPKTKLTIKECSQQTWVVPLKVCNNPNTVRVTTNARGRFKVKFTALVCPESRRGGIPAGFRRKCFVGVPTIQGIDTVTLLGVAKLVVTGP
jgi:hypothetical protein